MGLYDKKTAVITGATGGIGREITYRFLEAGISVYMLGRNFDKIRSSKKDDKRKSKKEIHLCQVDLNKESEILKTGQLIKKENEINYLVHGAAYYSYGSVEQTDINDLDKSYRVNVRAPYLLSQILLPKLIAAKGTIIFINSSVVNRGGKSNLTNYTSTKSALKSIADCLRQEINPKGVRVASIYLGKTATEMQKDACVSAGISYQPNKMIQPADAAEIIYQVATAPSSAEITDLHVRPSVSYD